MQPILHIEQDGDALARAAADWILQRLDASTGPFALNLSGGSTPKKLYALLASDAYRSRIPWDRVHLFFGDERYVPHDHPDSNFLMADESLIAHVPIPAANVHAIPSGPTPAEAAAAYEKTLKAFYGAETIDPKRPLFAVTLLGLGPDGHTASLFPGIPALDERKAWVLPVIGEKPPPQRITLTFPVLDSSAAVAFLMAGAEKHPMIERLRKGDTSIPSGRIAPHGELHWFMDKAAAEG